VFYVWVWQDKQRYLEVIHRHLEIHGTIGKRKSRFGGSVKDVPSYVVNHGVLKFDDLQALLKVREGGKGELGGEIERIPHYRQVRQQ